MGWVPREAFDSWEGIQNPLGVGEELPWEIAAPAPICGAMAASALYSRDILRLAASIPHLGVPDDLPVRVEKSSPVCGSRVTVAIGTDSEGRVNQLRQEVRACALGQASAALMGRHAIGQTAEELRLAHDALAAYLHGERDNPGDWPGLDIFDVARDYPARHAAILLAFDAAADAAAKARG